MVAILAKMEITCLSAIFVCLTFTIFTSHAIDSRVPSANFVNNHRPTSNSLDWSTGNTDDKVFTSYGDSPDNEQIHPLDDRISRRTAWRMIGRRSIAETRRPGDVIAAVGNTLPNRNRRASNHQSFFVRIGRHASKDDIRSGGPRHRRSHVMPTDRNFDSSDERWVIYDQNEAAAAKQRGVEDSYEKRGPNSFIRLGRSQTGVYDEVKRGPNSFIRLGRSHDQSRDLSGYDDDAMNQAASEEEYDVKRGPNSFIRLGRSRSYQTENDDMLEKSEADDIVKRGPNSFIRLGRSRDFQAGNDYSLHGVNEDVVSKRGPNSFIRLGRSQSSTAEEQEQNANKTTVSDEHDLQRQLQVSATNDKSIEKRGPSSFIKLGRRSANKD